MNHTPRHFPYLTAKALLARRPRSPRCWGGLWRGMGLRRFFADFFRVKKSGPPQATSSLEKIYEWLGKKCLGVWYESYFQPLHPMKPLSFWALLLALLFFAACQQEEFIPEEEPEPEVEEPAPRVGYEILQIVSPTEIITWMGLDITGEAFDSLVVPAGWIKNQPREGVADRGEFARSPSVDVEGEFVIEEHFGHQWRHVATVVEANVLLDDASLLRRNAIDKYHTLYFDADRTLPLLISPEGERYVLVSRDANRITDESTLPADWQIRDTLLAAEWALSLPTPTFNIRSDNEDSFQGPLPY